MNTDAFSKAAYALLSEGLALLRADAGESERVNAWCKVVEDLMAARRACVEPPVEAPVQPVCKVGCGTSDKPLYANTWFVRKRLSSLGSDLFYCSEACAENYAPLNPPPAGDSSGRR